jgi:O-acetyl-ADP-ribose deacetylase (regulator of RNase III)
VITSVRKGDLFQSGAQTLVNTVNTVGVMGKGVALAFKERFPDMYADYRRRCDAGQVRLGEPYLWRGRSLPWVINFPTKDHWRSVSKLADIERGLEYLSRHVEQWGVTSLAVPPLGAGSGHLDWATVGPVIYRQLDRLPIPVTLYAPFDAPDEQAAAAFLAQPVSTAGVAVPWLVIAEIVRRVSQARHAWPIGRTRLQKLAYFATSAGVPTGLDFVEASYGPFARDLTPTLARLVTDGILTEARAGRMLAVRPGPSFEELRRRHLDEIRRHEATIGRVVDLLVRLDGERTEIAASVHFAAHALATRLGRPPSKAEVQDKLRQWKQRRNPPLDDLKVAAAIQDLGVLGWIPLASSAGRVDEDDVTTVA